MVNFQAWTWLIIVFSVSFTARAVLVNRTIDDTYGDGNGNFVRYLPEGVWNVGGQCEKCSAKPDPDQLFSKSWHDGDFVSFPGRNNFTNQVLSASVTFNGSAVYVYCVLARNASSPPLNGNSDMSFYIDDVLVGTLVKYADSSDPYEYQVPVYVNESLPPGSHNFTLVNGHVNGTESLVLLDRIVYSFDDGVQVNNLTAPSSSISAPSDSQTTETSSSESGPSPHKILAVAIVLPIIFVLLLAGFGIFWFLRRRAMTKRSRRRLTSGTLDLHQQPVSGQTGSQNQDVFIRPFLVNIPTVATDSERRVHSSTENTGSQTSEKAAYSA
ncbi:hypothetical protein VKT23_010322 [Stygiomarasmius scandens]|uniref:Uncharacterized protein n=1 Tax=Marasmiellus scandens TaxID=2682957 RepID=A0ABR1JBA8_9AGAR